MFEWFFLFKQKTAYEVLISDWSSDVCSSDLGFILSNFRKRLLGLPKLAHTICECEFLTSQALDDAQELLTGQGILFLLSSRQWLCPLIGLLRHVWTLVASGVQSCTLNRFGSLIHTHNRWAWNHDLFSCLELDRKWVV